MASKGLGTVYFDQYRTEESDKAVEGAAGPPIDYSPLKRFTNRSLVMGALVSMGGMIFGYDTGQISGFMQMPDFMHRFGQQHSNGDYYFSNVRSGLIVGLLSIGTLFGALIAAPIADKVGRRPSISAWCGVTAVGFVIQIASINKWYQIMIGRFVAGWGVGALSLLVPMYQSESSPAWIRGAMVSTYQLFITFGIFLAACFNYGTVTHQPNNSASWRTIIGLGWLWTIILGVGILFLPETPRFEFRQGNVQSATDSLCRMYGASPNHYAIRNQIEEIETKLKAENHSNDGRIRTFCRMFSAPRMAYRIFIGVSIQALQQLTGANYFFYYGTTIFESVNIDSYVTQIILNTINFAVTFIGLWMIEHFGRRKSLMTGSIWMFICFLIFASVGHFSLDRADPKSTRSAGIALIVFACFFILGFATTWGPMIWTIMAEIYPSEYRASAMSLATASNWIWNFLIAFFTPFITGAIDFRYGYVFAGCNVLGFLMVYFFVVEGKGRTLEEIDTMYLQGVLPWKSAEWIPPTADEMERTRKESTSHPTATMGENMIVDNV
ncbi:major facilitator superfamily transporter monosaccharide [Grosmannia clavigera kw1407]|uniref:Major facilitator superfamily transporter monosaccharide n=1 Tax=Grosmannia clavigera (strain kw1407 / UAMH 11150) TaxID=655863 RepID=F0XHQ4_GROCL|nr:major facilitator superfamily transporter monosaccharide [Grosmannia clavigera kw1407]EFX02725.1 major facilitator superfamily transporter monosaccharide [Grosmannia clavigera kw1407]